MCGIAGFFGFRDDKLIKNFSEQLRHRGPDGEGYFIDANTTLLNRRLAIIDRKGGDQPIYNEDRSLVVVYNGEIYNYLELRSALEKKGHKFTTNSDTEVIVHGYEEWKDGCFDKFNGMFAIALYDLKNKELILARDHFGIKPLYYALGNSSSRVTRFIFSSELKPIFYSGLIEKKPNDRIIYRYLRYRIHDDNEETFFEGIKKLMPGEMMRVKRSIPDVQRPTLSVKRYTNLIQELKDSSAKQPKNKTVSSTDLQKFKELLIRAIKYRLISEVPVGTCLSGGLDSSTIVSAVNKLLDEKAAEARSVGEIQNTFSAVFSGSTNDEEKYVDLLVKNLKSKVQSHKIRANSDIFFKEIEDFVKTQEEPTISTGPYAQYKVMQEACKYVTVLLDGQGADEMLAGYIPHYAVYFRQLCRERKYLKLVGELFNARDVIGSYLKRKPVIDAANYINSSLNDQYKQEKFTVITDNLKERLINDVFFNSLPSLLRYEDRNSMRFSVEGRLPYLDINLIKLIFSFSDEAIIKNGWNKYILRQAVKDILPGKIINRRNKIGFTTPEHEWFMRLKNRIYSIFMSESFIKRKYFNQPAVITGFQKFIEGKTDDTMVFWRMLNLELWLREFFDNKSQKSHLRASFAEVATEAEQGYGGQASLRVNELGKPNENKKLEIMVIGKKYLRFPVRTDLFKKGDNVTEKVSRHVIGFLSQIRPIGEKKHWFVVVSEKIVAVAQGRSYFLYEIKPGFFAKLLSKHVKKTPYGIGLGSPWTMQLAINEKGLTRIILASLVSLITKPFGFHGLFYKIAGPDIAAIDGPTEYSLYPSNVSAKLAPKEPEKVAANIDERIKRSTLNVKRYLGSVIIDANDLGQNVLGNSTGLENKLIEKIFADNPMGQSDEQTPIAIVYEE